MTFNDLKIIPPILRSLDQKGYTIPTPIQQQAIPILLQGKDLLGCAQTGTGKTAAFSIPIIQNLYNQIDTNTKIQIRALIVTPTRELAIQIHENIVLYSKFTGLSSTVVYGGVKQGSQTKALGRGVDILIATPGRLLDLIGQRYISLKNIKYFVLDEADQMLDMGFIHDIKRIISLIPEKRQSLFFSATMPPEIVSLSKEILGNPEKVTIQPEQTTAEKVAQKLYFVPKKQKSTLLIHLLEEQSFYTVLVFSRTKHGADKIAGALRKAGFKADAIHGNRSQNQRQRSLENFKNGKTHVLVATDIAARGIDVSDLSLVVNYDLPNVPESYVHRIGRTGRAKASGIAISFCDLEERPYLKDIEKLIKQTIPVDMEHPYVDSREDVKPAPKSKGSNRSSSKSNKNWSKNKSQYRGKGGNKSRGNRSK